MWLVSKALLPNQSALTGCNGKFKTYCKSTLGVVDVLKGLNFHHRVLNSKADLGTFAEKFRGTDTHVAHHLCYDEKANFAYT
jgi:hypothetical protein